MSNNKLQHGHTSSDDGGTLTASAIPALAAFDRVIGSGGDVTTTSTTLVDLVSLTITTTGRL